MLNGAGRAWGAAPDGPRPPEDGARAPAGRLHVLLTVTGAPELLRVQLRAIARFLPAGTGVTVVDDSRRRAHFSNGGEPRLARRLRALAAEAGARYVRFPQHRHFHRRSLFGGSAWGVSRDASLRTADAIQFGLTELALQPEDSLALLDADLVPIGPFQPAAYFARAPAWLLPQSRETPLGVVRYPWNGLFLSRAALIVGARDFRWDCDTVAGVRLDTGGAARHWLARNAPATGALTGLHSGQWLWSTDAPQLPAALHEFLAFDAAANAGRQFAELFEGTFLHLRAGGNWLAEKRQVFAARLSRFTQGLERLLAAPDA